ncbi:hypothetical protein B0A48_06307 [Cryoendolithus antarcticus]|uniref:Uncharacterized protein n=1 Tax=Cryoendolithus antarcticus TaxID=1507870 RepID=A0A1V8TAI4_9PEZI|nr:hypothetical protein B0A48_06307 [Cryoendolithus antarcticus]
MPLLRPLPAHLGLILPLCTASAQLGLSLASLPLFAAFLSPKKDSQGNLTKISGKPLSHFLASYSGPLATTNLILTLTTVASGLLSFRWLTQHQTLETGQVGWWYAVGVVFAGVQMGFAPLVAPGMLRIVGQVKEAEGKREAEVQGENEKDMATLFFVYVARTVLGSLPAVDSEWTVLVTDPSKATGCPSRFITKATICLHDAASARRRL